jgi:L-seryl-tRNA(Ser) seleniumtransferase
MANMLRNLPSVQELLNSPPLQPLVQRMSRNVVVTKAGQFLEGMRQQVSSAASSAATAVHLPTPSELAQRIADWIAAEQSSPAPPVINATGILLHPQLGGAPLADEALQAAAAAGGNYTAADLDLSPGEPAARGTSAERLLTKLTGAEAALVVNTHAGAAVIALAALAGGREVLVSRGQVVEIPGSHRLPDVAAASGAVLREVGTANRTSAGDFASALGDKSAAVLHVQAANLSPSGAQHASLAELAALARKHKLPLIDDLVNGGLIDLSAYGLQGEARAADSLAAGADLVVLGGARLLGGPECGLIVGRRALIEKIAAHPLMSALRPSKAALAALGATLQLYEDLPLAERCVPLLSLLTTPVSNLQNRAERLAPQISATGIARAEVAAGVAHVLGGSTATQAVPTVSLVLTPTGGTASALQANLRGGTTPVLGRIAGDNLLLDLRSVLPRQDLDLIAACEALSPAKSAGPPEASSAESK